LAAKPASGKGPLAFAAAEYVKFAELPPADASEHARTWYARGQNFVVGYSEVQPGARFTRDAQPDEWMFFMPEQGEGAVVEAGGERVEVPGYSIVVVPPGASSVTLRQPGTLVRVFSTRNTDVAALAANAEAYAEPHPNIPPFAPWPAPPGGYRIRHYSLDVPPQPGRF